MNEQIHIFDRALVRLHRERAAASFPRHSALYDEAADLLLERLADVKRDFSNILDLGARHGLLARKLAQREGAFVVASDLSRKLLASGGLRHAVVADEEFLPFAAASFDLVVSNLDLHWINDLPGALAQIKMTLRPDGLFLATFLGGQTLHELRSCLLDAELLVTGGGSPRLSPSITLQTASVLLQRAGFALPVSDQETVTLTYIDIFALMHDLRGMGEANAHAQRSRHPARREIFHVADRLYKQRHAFADGRIPATFEIIFIHGWN